MRVRLAVGKPRLSRPACPVDDQAANAIRGGQQTPRRLELATGQQRANPGAGDRLPFRPDRLDHLQANRRLRAELVQKLDGPASLPAEGEVGPFDQPGRQICRGR